MRIGIIVAMDKELSLLLPMIEGHKTEDVLGFYFHKGTIGRHEGINVMDVVVADSIAYHDVWCGHGTDYGQAAGMPMYFVPDKNVIDLLPCSDNIRHGLICSGDKFIDKMASVEEIKTHFPEALAVDMESAAIAHVCNKMHVPMFCMRVISDSPGASHNNSRQYEDFWSAAPEQTFEIVRQLLEKLK